MDIPFDNTGVSIETSCLIIRPFTEVDLGDFLNMHLYPAWAKWQVGRITPLLKRPVQDCKPTWKIRMFLPCTAKLMIRL